MEREEIFKLIQSKSWISLIEIFKRNDEYENIQSDGITKKILDEHFVNELIFGNKFSEDPAYTEYLSQFYILHKAEKFNFKFSESDFEKLIEKLVNENFKKGYLDKAFNYAIEFPKNKSCIDIIKKYQIEQSKFIEHTQRDKISLKKNIDISEIDNTISIFRSIQEFTFYKSVRDVFQTYMVFPNVALNAVIDFNSIKSKLNNDERSYFFKGLVDCVVIDQENNYKPFKFIELDSKTHDKPKQILNDNIKDKIIALSGYKLFRIRSAKKIISEEEFVKLIREVINR